MSTLSIITCTRQRVSKLSNMLNSAISMCLDKNRVTYYFRIDADDVDTIVFLRRFLENPNIKVICGERGRGYLDTAKWLDEMAKLSSSDLIMCCNDDAIFETQGWDNKLLSVLSEYPDKIVDIGVNTVYNFQGAVFPCVSRRWIEKVGFLAHPDIIPVDTMVRNVAEKLGRMRYLPDVVVRHNWPANDSTFHDGSGKYISEDTWSVLRSKFYAEIVDQIVDKLRRVMI